MIQIILTGVVTFIVVFCFSFFLGFVKNKEGKKSLELSIIAALAAGVTAAIAFWFFDVAL